MILSLANFFTFTKKFLNLYPITSLNLLAFRGKPFLLIPGGGGVTPLVPGIPRGQLLSNLLGSKYADKAGASSSSVLRQLTVRSLYQ